MLWLTILVFIVIFLAFVLVHELGHFLTAKAAGCRVDEFAFGFPPRLWSVVRGGTRYCFNALPIGGYVKIKGENMDEENPDPDSFASKSAGWRILILTAGVLMNVVLAAVVLSVQAGIGVPTLVTDENAASVRDIKTFVVTITPGSPAEVSGLKELDRLVRVGELNDPTIAEVQRITGQTAGQELLIEIERQGQHEMITLVPRTDPPAGEGAMGIGLQEAGLEKVAWWQAPLVGIKRTGEMLIAIVTEFGRLFGRLAKEGMVGDSLVGPVGIAIYTNEMTKLGLSYVLEFAALISLNLAIINILPFPALDGGRVLFVVIEVIIGRRLPSKFESLTHLTGFALLILLLVVITFKDALRFF